MRISPSIGLALAAGLLATIANAGPTPTQKCTSAKLKASGKSGSANDLCAAKAADKNLAIDPLCLQKSDDKLVQSFAKAEAKGGCLTVGDSSAIGAILDDVTAFAESDLGHDGSTASRKCASSRRKATGKYINSVLGCHAKAEIKGLPVDVACIFKARDKLMQAFDKSSAVGGCTTVADFSGTQMATDVTIGEVLDALFGGGGTTTTTTTTSTTTTTLGTVSLASDVQPILTANCATGGCHAGAFPAQGMNLSAGMAHAALVNVSSNECPGTLRVDPGSPSTSYLVHKLAGSGPCFIGNQMPLFSSPLSPAQQALISAWISQGALNN